MTWNSNLLLDLLVLWVHQTGLSWVILLLYVALTEVTHWYFSAFWSGLECPGWLYSHAWMVGRPGLVVPPFPCSVRASADDLSARVVGLLTRQLRTSYTAAQDSLHGSSGLLERLFWERKRRLTNRCSITPAMFYWLKTPQGTPGFKERGCRAYLLMRGVSRNLWPSLIHYMYGG